MTRIGFIGLGIMGRPMASNLMKAGHQLYLHRVKPISQGLVDQGGTACASAREVAERADVVILMLPDTPVVGATLFGPGGVAEGLSPGKIVIDMSSSDPIATRDFAKRIAELGCDYLDAPVSGGDVGAREATLAIMVGGPQTAFDKAKPLFEAMGRNVTLVGPSGAGQTCKVANQIIVALNIQAVAEALLFATKAGADPAKVRQALMGGFASSKVLEVHGDRITTRNFEPGARIPLHQKDLALALEGARALGVSLPNAAKCQQFFNACVAHGGANWDHAGLYLALETMAGGKA